jgi:hypothetical protein
MRADIIHGQATKAWLRQQVEMLGPGVLGHHTVSTAAALALIDADPREYFVLGRCDNQRPDGSCAGHPLPRPSLYRWRCSCRRRSATARPWPQAERNARAHAKRCGHAPILEEVKQPKPRIERPNPEAWVYG